MTPAVEMLRQLGIAHRVVEYDHDPTAPSYGEEAAELLGLEPEAVFKTLMAETSDGQIVVAVVPVPAMLDLRALAGAVGSKRMSMADPHTAQRRSGYVVGGISPFGQRNPSPTFVDEWATALDEIHVSGGRRGLEIAIAPEALTIALRAEFAPIAAWG